MKPAPESGVEQERAWTESDPAAVLVHDAPGARVFRIEGLMDPSGCEAR